jgi:hypothetical protein
MPKLALSFAAVVMLSAATPLRAAQLHVSLQGDDAHPGTVAAPLRTIQRAAELAQPGDTITVHEGVYRERVNPPRGGESDAKRIVYQAAPGAHVAIKGSEVVKNWVRDRGDVWKATLPNSFFGDFNPYADPIRGDWFDPRGRTHHTGAVYLNGQWLTEAATLDEVMLPNGAKPAWLTGGGSGYLLNVAWWQPTPDAGATGRIAAAAYAAHQGIQNAACTEGGQCIGFIEHGDWVRYDDVNLGQDLTRMEFRVASASQGGLIEIRLDQPDGELLGTADVPSTGDWQRWTTVSAQLKPASGTQPICLVFKSRMDAMAWRGLSPQLWFAQTDDANTTIWAQFTGVDPNREEVEINVRQTVFYPDQPGRNFITVRGFTMQHAATPWAPPTAEQIGLIGTHWSKGWIIENNVISHSVCTGITLGKHGDEFDNTSANTAEGYVKTIERAHAFAIPWTRDHIGHHIVRHNTISHCEQAGLVGSLGAAFSTITGNTIHDIHIRRLFSGAEMAGIKIHAAIDTTISCNHVYRCCQALWLDWMAQGTRVTGNLFHDNEDRDLFMEVNHGPYLVDNNLFLSPMSLLDMSEGGAFVHNLFAGRFISQPEPNRETPFHPAHSTVVAGLARTQGGDNRFYYNLFVGNGKSDKPDGGPAAQAAFVPGSGLWVYDQRPLPQHTGGNVYCFGPSPYAREKDPLVLADADLALRLMMQDGPVTLRLDFPAAAQRVGGELVTTERLGRAAISNERYENADGSPLTIDTDYFGKPRSAERPTPGPFAAPGSGSISLKVR